LQAVTIDPAARRAAAAVEAAFCTQGYSFLRVALPPQDAAG